MQAEAFPIRTTSLCFFLKVMSTPLLDSPQGLWGLLALGVSLHRSTMETEHV